MGFTAVGSFPVTLEYIVPIHLLTKPRARKRHHCSIIITNNVIQLGDSSYLSLGGIFVEQLNADGGLKIDFYGLDLSIFCEQSHDIQTFVLSDVIERINVTVPVYLSCIQYSQ